MSSDIPKQPAVLPTHTPALFAEAVQRTVELLRAGELVAVPTETVYGLAGNAFDAVAVEKIFEMKGRPKQNPIIVHVASFETARSCVADWPEIAGKLATSFWPGPLTMVLPRSKDVPDVVTAGGATVGLRWPSHPFMQAVIRECGFPLAAPSANLANQVSPTNAEHVRRALGNKIALIVDGGQSQVGIESTVLDLTATPPRLLRPGMIHEESLLAVTGELTLGFGDSEEVLKSPGLLKKHYSPKAKLVLLSWRDESDLKRQLDGYSVALAKVHLIAHTKIPLNMELGRVSVIPHDAEAFARAIYAELHHCDEAGAELIVVEELPRNSEWRGIADRLQRAAA
ncbi:MAG: threonylcarbamoyl-AMP synthase [Verrucomicrobia bacterium]|nr:threonylcarbamoyl-AMP synthase [Verrucomicrobiota bacterium]